MSNIPGITTAALNAIQDENTRIVLNELVAGWQIRNAGQGSGAQAFVTRDQLTQVLEADQLLGNKGIWPKVGGVASQVAGAQVDVANSQAFIDLSTTVAGISNAVVLEQQNRTAAVQAVADDLEQEVLDRIGLGTALGGAIGDLQEVTDAQALAVTSLTTRVGTAESGITTLNQTTGTQALAMTALTTRVDTAESTITTLNQTSGTQALALTALTTRVGTAETNITNLIQTTGTQALTLTSLSTRVDTAEGAITTLNQTTANQAQTLTTLTASVGQKARTFFQTAAPADPITGDLWFDSDDGNKPYRWSGTAWVGVGQVISLDGVMAAITNEATARANADTAITNSLTTQFSGVNDSIALLQGAQTTTTNNVSALSQSMATLQTTIGDDISAAVEVEALARANVDGDILAKYAVKVDVNGHVAGYGLISEANDGNVVSSFIVRADKFAISNTLSGALQSVMVPFVVENNQVFITQAAINKLSAGVIDVEKLAGQTYGYVAAGTYQVQVPVGFTTVKLTIRAGGGGAGVGVPVSNARGGGGGQGGLGVFIITGVTPGSMIDITVGAGGDGSPLTSPVNMFVPATTAQAGTTTTVTVMGSTYSVLPGQPGSDAYAVNTGSSIIGHEGTGGAGGTGGGSGSTGESGQNGGASGGTPGAFGTGGGGGVGSGAGGSYNKGKGKDGSVLVEVYNPNGVVLRSEWSTLIQHLSSRTPTNTYTWP